MRPAGLLTVAVLSVSVSGWELTRPLRAADEYETLLLGSIKSWDDFQKRFKKIVNPSISKDGDVTVLKGTVEAYGVQNSTFEARFPSATQISRLVVTLDPGNAKDRRLRSDLSSKIARGQPDLEDWLPKVVRDARDQLLVDRIEVDFGEGNTPTRAMLVSVWGQPLRPITGLDLTVGGVEFRFIVTDPSSRQRAGLTAQLGGKLSVGPTSTSLTGSITSRESRETWLLSAQLNELRLQSLLEAIMGAGALSGLTIPAEVAGLTLREGVLELDQSKSSVSARANSGLGVIGLRAQRGKSGPSFQLGVAPPAGFKFASLAQELSVMDALSLDNSAIVIASEAAQADLPNISAINGQQLGRGVTMLGGFNLRGASPQVANMLKVDRLNVRGTVGTTLSDVRFEGKIDTQIELVPNSRAAVLRGISVKLVPAPTGTTVSLGGLVDVKADRQTLTFAADVGIDFMGPSMFISGQLAEVDGKASAYWSNPFGIAAGLHVKDLALMLGINLGAPIPLPILGLQGELVAGNLNNPDFRGRAAIGIDPADPQKTVIDVGFDKLVLRQILTAAAPQTMRTIPREIQYALDIGLHDARLTLVPSPSGADLFGVHYDPGFLVQGKAQIMNWSGELYVAVGANGLEARGIADAIDAKPWFALTGARGEPKPYLNIRIEPGPNSFVAFNGAVMVLGLQAETDVLMYSEGFDFFLGGKVFGGMFEASIEVAGGDLKNGGSLYAIAEMKNDMFRYISENASREIDAATKTMQADISKAQGELRKAQSDLQAADREVAAYRAQLERARNQTCLDIKNSNQDVRRAEADVASARNRLNSLPNDPGVVAARNKLVVAEQDLARAREAVGRIEQDPGVVAARNKLLAAEAELNRARSDVNAIDRDPGVINARNRFNAAQAEVNKMNGQVAAQQNTVNDLSRRYDASSFPESAKLWIELQGARTYLGTLIAAREVATGVLTAARQTMDGSIQAAIQVGQAGITASERLVQTSRQAYDGTISAARQTAEFGVRTAEGTVSTSRQAYDGLVIAGQQVAQSAMQAAEGTLQATQATVQASYDACVAAPIEIDPRLATLIGAQETAKGAIKVSDGFLEGIKQAATGTMVAADWIVKNGNPMGVVNIEYAKFEGCLAAVEGGKVALAVRGKFAGSPFSGEIDLNFANPIDAVEYLAEYLITNKTGPPPRMGGCAKPSFAGRPGRPNTRAAANRVPANAKDLQGAPPQIAVPQKPANMGVLPRKS